ncbi:glyoxalase/bleomycin resistance protein/dioxygenase [alpha proteobacterium BAL199]|jgi:catechol 2,3-dioxygenase-like lactoylglutathione lyase family enzyme|nr:glyoxalase/bleomycin resistance protein/dioxygenase [alpha proteobacterium BAL199]
MPIQKLDHVNVRTTDLDTMIGFCERILGLKKGRRPGFDFPGAWMYAGDQAIVHLVGASEKLAEYRPDQQLEHYALSATGLADFLAHLRAEKVAYYCRVLPDFGIRQVNIFDPDGNHLHIDFPADEEADLSDYDGAS